MAGVTVSIGLNGDSIFGKANEAETKWNNEALKEEIKLAMSLYYNEPSLEDKLECLKEKGITVELITELGDACYVTKGNMQVTVYEDGDILDGKVSIWGGENDIESPTFKNENGVVNWYISTAGQLKFLADFVNDGDGTTLPSSLVSYVTGYNDGDVLMTADTTIFLMNSLDLGARPSTEEIIDTEITDEVEKEIARQTAKWNNNPDNLKWTPIGKDSSHVRNKLGIFEGNGNTIQGMYVNENDSYCGLFGNANTIKHLTIKNSLVIGKTGSGAFTGLTLNSIEDCNNVNTCVIANSDSAGGIFAGRYRIRNKMYQ